MYFPTISQVKMIVIDKTKYSPDQNFTGTALKHMCLQVYRETMIFNCMGTRMWHANNN